VQVEAVLSGVQPGLSMVVGPPGTGKTDVAVQVLNVLYHTNPQQRTLLITHSNQALNDLFSKLMARDIPARYLLRLGQGETELDTELDFSRVGRVNAMLERRIALLAEVEAMAVQFGVPADAAYTCETAAHFWLLHVLSRWEKFRVRTIHFLYNEAIICEDYLVIVIYILTIYDIWYLT
jgi:intron-binding protein aquarius